MKKYKLGEIAEVIGGVTYPKFDPYWSVSD